jgi:hypothetical protein
MRVGRENGLLFPNTNGSTGQVLFSQGNGNVSWGTPDPEAIGAVTLTTTQTVSGQKTFSASQTNFGSSGPTTLNTSGSQIIFQQTGSASGTSRLTLTNDFQRNGAVFEQVTGPDLVDFAFLTPTGQANVRYERRPIFFKGEGSTFEFQIGTPDTPELIVANNGVLVKAGIPLKAGNIRLDEEVPTSSAEGSVTLGARSLAGRMTPVFVGPSGLDATIQAHIGRNKISMLMPIVGATAPSLWGLAAQTVIGTAQTRTVSGTSLLSSLRRIGYVSGTSTTSGAGYRNPTLQWWRGNFANAGGFHFHHTFGIVDSTVNGNKRMFVGMVGSTAAPTNVQPNTVLNIVGVCKMAGSNNMQMVCNSGTGTGTLVDLGSNFPATGSNLVYTLSLFSPPNGSFIGWRLDRQDQVFTASGIFNSNIPASDQFLTTSAWAVTNTAGPTVSIELINFYVETDN